MIEILWMLVKSFFVGGLLCAIGQVLIMKTQLTSARILRYSACSLSKKTNSLLLRRLPPM